MMPLAGIRVLDFTQFLSGSYCSMLMGDLGAEVIKIEKPDTGEVYLTYGPLFIRVESTSFLGVNRNKKSLALNLKTPEALAIVQALARTSDVVVENYTPGTMAKLGIDYESLRVVNPALIYASVSGFGQTGPYRDRGGFDLILQGMSGLMSVTGEADGPPAKVGVPITDIGAGLYALIGVLAALIAREKTGRGQQVDASLLEAGLAFNFFTAINYFADGTKAQRLGSASPQNAPYQAFKTRNGHITVGTGNDVIWKRFCDALGLGHLLQDPRFKDNASRVRRFKDLESEIAPVFESKTTAESLALMDKAQVPAGPIYDIGEAVQDEHVRSRG
ncbi:MAG: CoA transferase, partial [Armatimonadetes bacterium]|nr:CoA transferase [Armatimonadota bacterium]